MLHFQRGLLQFKTVSQLGRPVVITDTNVEKLMAKPLSERLGAELIAFPCGEQYKTRETKAWVEDQLILKGYGRDTCIIAVGGGVVTDLAGFVAATYCRGVALILVPTTLLGIVDAAIGGKTAVNHPKGKNMIGAFYPANETWIDPEVLATLPRTEMQNGLVEMVKHALIHSYEAFQELEGSYSQLQDYQIQQSCDIKAKIVAQDPTENGMRRLLNFGHTIGHALEVESDYNITHGEAVAIGILAECRIAVEMQLMPKEDLERIHTLLRKIGLPLVIPENISHAAILSALRYDKKAREGKPRFALIEGIGKPLEFNGAYCSYIESIYITRALEWMSHALSVC